MAKRNIRIRHRRSRSPSPPGIRTRSPPGPPRKPANILETPQEVLENRKDAAVDAPIKEAAAAVKSCKGWTDLSYTRQYPNVNPVQQGGKTCRPGHMVGVSQKTEYFSSAVLSGITVGALIVSFVVMGVFALMLLQTNSKYPSMDDAQIIVSTRNE